jgi:hypothetical protein
MSIRITDDSTTLELDDRTIATARLSQAITALTPPGRGTRGQHDGELPGSRQRR